MDAYDFVTGDRGRKLRELSSESIFSESRYPGHLLREAEEAVGWKHEKTKSFYKALLGIGSRNQEEPTQELLGPGGP